METHAEEASKALKSAEKKLQHALDKTEPDHAQLEQLLERVRVYSGNESLKTYYLTDDPAEEIEFRLWDAHVKVNGKFKLLLKTFREGEGRKKHVERRKAEKLYLEFIKASQRFYRAYIQRLASNFTGVPKVEETIRVLNQEILSPPQTKPAGPQLRFMLERSCKQTIIRLGDLSRWRETELSRKERNWSPAIGYYQYALVLDPSDGVCYNQLAVIAQADDNHLNAVYYFHRAAAVEKPSPTAVDNIRLKFEKVLKAGYEDTLGTVDMSHDIVSVLEKRFLAFHAECYVRPFDFVSFTQKATDIVRLIAIGFEETQDHTFDAVLAKICLVNITAEYLAKRGAAGSLFAKQLSEEKVAQETERSRQAFVLLQRFNMMTFQALLKVLSREMEGLHVEGGETPKKGVSHLSPIAGRVLPQLRQYSSWLLTNASELVSLKLKSSRTAIDLVWQVYVQALNLLLTNVDVFSPPQVSYLLKEDEDTTAFGPFSHKVKEWRFRSSGPAKKSFDPKFHVSSPDAEVHLRATDLVIDALRFVKHKDDLNLKDSPLVLNGQSFEYHKLPEPEAPPAPPSPPKKLWRSRAHAQAASMSSTPVATTPEPDANQNRNRDSKQLGPVGGDAIMAENSQSDMEHMVSDLVDQQPPQVSVQQQRTSEYPPVQVEYSHRAAHTPRTGSGQMTAMDLVRQMQKSSVGGQSASHSPQATFSALNPLIPNIYHTAFTPTAGETATFGSRPGTAHQYSPPSSAKSLRSSGVFAEQMARHQHDIENRSSPISSFQPTPSWGTFGQQPTGADWLFRAAQQREQSTSPFASPSARVNGHTMPSPRQAPQAALFGVIGQQRKTSQSTPSGDQADWT